MMLYLTDEGPVVESEGRCYGLDDHDPDALLSRDDLPAFLPRAIRSARRLDAAPQTPRAPIHRQEVWAAGVTYYRSRSARMEEAEPAGGGSFYDRVYDADRPELFMKATPGRVVDPGSPMRLRRDSNWVVPEPELTLAISAGGRIVGYTVGNDLSCRDIEGENPLYLPQAKTFDRCAAVGPGILITDEPMPAETRIDLDIRRHGDSVFTGSTDLGRMKRTPQELVDYLYRESSFPDGCLLMTGTGIVPGDDFTLQPDDEVRITIEPIGTLINPVD